MTQLQTQLTRVIEDGIEDGRVRSWRDACAVSLRTLDKPLPPSDDLVIRAAMSSPDVSAVFTARVNSQILAGFEGEPDSTAGWIAEVPSVNFLGSDLFAADGGGRLEKLPRGGTATDLQFSMKRERLRIARYAGTLKLDEQDLANAGPISLTDAAAREVGAAARRLKLDLIYSLLLSNPTMGDDSTALFHADHGNLGAVTLDETNLGAAWSAVASQTIDDPTHDDSALHLNLQPQFLIVAPALVAVARKAVRNLTLDDGQDLEVRAESRLGPVGVVDPDDHDVVVEGDNTAWLLAARAAQRPGLVVSGLNGSLAPSIRQTDLDRGQWGRQWDVVLDIGAAALDWRPLYYSQSNG